MKCWFGRLLRTAGCAALLAAPSSVSADLLLLLEGDKENTPAPQVALDSSGNGNHGVYRGNSSRTDSGRTGGGLSFDGTSGTYMALNTADDGAFDTIFDEQAFTVAFWMNGGENQPSNNSAFWAAGIEGATDRAFQAHVPWGNGSVFFDIGGCCGGTQRVSAPIDEAFWKGSTGDEWTHWTFTLDGEFGDAAVYIDGVLEPTLERFGPTDEVPQLSLLHIGGDNNGNNNIDAVFDDFAIWDERLSDDDISDMFDDGVRSIVDGIPDEPEEYTPIGGEGRLVNLDGKLGGAAYFESGDITSWRVEQIFRTMAGGEEVVVAADLSQVGVAGEGNVGGPGEDVQLGDVDLTNNGADDKSLEFRLSIESNLDPILGQGETFITETFVLPGSGGGNGCGSPLAASGDVDCDGDVDLSDFNILKENFGAVAAAEAVPEPSSIALLGLGGLAALVALRRRK